MKVVILAGGLGTRISEYTKTIPKPMINIKGKPIIQHIMNHYSRYGFKHFIIALGYKGHVIKKYFQKKKSKFKIELIETGKNTMTGGRLKRLTKYLGDETFMLTYGDGISNVNINKLIKFHKDMETRNSYSCQTPGKVWRSKVKTIILLDTLRKNQSLMKDGSMGVFLSWNQNF